MVPRLALGILLLGTTACEETGVSPSPASPGSPTPAPNRAPVAVGAIPSLTVVEGRLGSVDIASSFSDPDGDPLTYSAASSDAGIATVSASGNEVTVTGVAAGSAVVTVTATDPGGLSAISEFAVTVEEPGQPAEALFDSLMVEFTEKHGIGAAALGIMKDGEIVYDRAFGWIDRERTIPIRQDVMMRLASVTKPITAAAIHELARERALDLDRFVFDLGQAGGGLLDLAPFPSLGDIRLTEVTVRQLLQHRGGWDRDIAGDLANRDIHIAEAMSVPSPPGRENTVRYILGPPLEFDPGSRRAYSNIGYLILGLVIEEASGQDYLSYVFGTVLAPLGVRSEDIIQARTFPKDRSPREPWYDYDGSLARNVFDPEGPRVRRTDGGWDLETRIAHGGLVASTRPILTFLDVYKVSGEDIGTRRGSEGPGWWHHGGALSGTSTRAVQRGDGINYVVLFNRRRGSPEERSYSSQLHDLVQEILDTTRIEWPEPRRAALPDRPRADRRAIAASRRLQFYRDNMEFELAMSTRGASGLLARRQQRLRVPWRRRSSGPLWPVGQPTQCVHTVLWRGDAAPMLRPPSNPRPLAPLPEQLADRGRRPGRRPGTPAPVRSRRSGAPLWSPSTSHGRTRPPAARRRPSRSPTSGSGPTRA